MSLTEVPPAPPATDEDPGASAAASTATGTPGRWCCPPCWSWRSWSCTRWSRASSSRSPTSTRPTRTTRSAPRPWAAARTASRTPSRPSSSASRTTSTSSPASAGGSGCSSRTRSCGPSSCVVFHFAIGLALAVLLQRQFKGRSLYRVLLIVPWAVPSFVSAFAWKFMFNQRFGLINATLDERRPRPGRVVQPPLDRALRLHRHQHLDGRPVHDGRPARRAAVDQPRTSTRRPPWTAPHRGSGSAT